MSGAVENAGYVAQLGFDIDTAGLTGGKASVESFTGSLDRMANAADRAGAAAGKPSSAIRRTGDDAATASGKVRAMAQTLANVGQQSDSVTGHMHALHNAATAFASGGLDGLNRGLTSSLGLLGRMPSVMAPVGMAMAGLGTATAGLATAYVGLVSATAPVQERYMLLEARLKSVYGSQAAAKQQMAEIVALAQKNGVAIGQTADAYLRLARNNEAIGLTRRQTVELTNDIQMLGRVGSITSTEMSIGMMQFTQAMAAGRLNGDELRSVIENMQPVARAIADGLGVTVGQLRAMGAAGELTAEKVTNAILKQGPLIQKEFEGLPQTTDQAFTRVSNAWETMLKDMGTALNASGVMSGLADGVTQTINKIDKVVVGTTPEEQLDALRTKLRNRANFPTAQNDYDNYGPALVEMVHERNRARAFSELSSRALDRSADVQGKVSRATDIIKELDEQAKKVAELNTQFQTLREIKTALAANPDVILKQDEIERLKSLDAVIASIQSKLVKERMTPLGKSYLELENRRTDMQRYGSGGGIGFGSDVRKLMGSGSATNPISQQQAEIRIGQERVLTIQQQTEALRQQIEQERRLASVAGQGWEARMRMQVTNDTEQYRTEQFGTRKDLAPSEQQSLKLYEKTLLDIAKAKKATADADATASNMQEMSIQRHLAEARAAGANVGALRELEHQLRKVQALRDGRTGDALGQDLKMFMEREEGRKKLSDMFRDVEDRRTALNAASPSDARRMSQEAQARRYSEGFSPDQQRAAYDAKMLDLHVQDQETIKRTLDDKRQAVLLQRQEIEAARVGGLAGQIIAAKARELNEIRASGLKLTQAEVEARLKLAELSVVQGETLRRTQEQADGYINIWTTAANSVGGAIDDVFQKVLDGQEVKIEDLLKRIASQVGSAIIQETITRPLTNIFRQFAESARGGVAVPSLGATASPLGPVAGGAMSGVQAANQNFAGMAQAVPPSATGMTLPEITSRPIAPVAPTATQLATARLTSEAGNGRFSEVGNFAARNRNLMDPRLVDIMRTASVKGGYNVEAFSGWGYRTNKAGQRVGTFHDDGMALDMRLIGDNGKPIPNFQNARSFRAYEEFAQNARLVQMQKYPELTRDFRWGGYFSKASRGGTGMDMMHFDLGGRRLGMAGGSWEGGLTASMRAAYPGAQSTGMSQQVMKQITSQWQQGMNTANQTIASNMPKHFDSPVKSIASMFSKNIEVGPLQKLSPAISGVTQASSAAVPALGGFGNGIMNLLQQIIPGIGSSLIGSMFGSAHGSVYEGGVRMYGNGGVVTRPFAFKTRGGMGVMGEAGPEAIMPLRRGPDGKLGVAAAGGGGGGDVSVVVNDMRSSAGSHPVETESKKGPNGQRMIAVTIRDQVRSQMKGGKFDAAMNQSYGVGRKLTGR